MKKEQSVRSILAGAFKDGMDVHVGRASLFHLEILKSQDGQCCTSCHLCCIVEGRQRKHITPLTNASLRLKQYSKHKHRKRINTPSDKDSLFFANHDRTFTTRHKYLGIYIMAATPATKAPACHKLSPVAAAAAAVSLEVVATEEAPTEAVVSRVVVPVVVKVCPLVV